MEYNALEFWFSVGQWVFNLIVAAYLWISHRHTATNHRLSGVEKDLSGRIDKTEKCVVKLQSDLAHLPTVRDMERLRNEITGMTREISEARGQLKIINQLASRVDEFLLHNGSK